jgi:hypothetical protein
MSIDANVTFIDGRFVATLSDGRKLDQPYLREFADALFNSGVQADNVSYQWSVGHRMITAGQQVALVAAIRQREGEGEELRIAA